MSSRVTLSQYCSCTCTVHVCVNVYVDVCTCMLTVYSVTLHLYALHCVSVCMHLLIDVFLMIS